MVRRDGAAIRKERIKDIAIKIQSLLHKHGEIQLSKTVAILKFEIGLTKEKIMEYLRVLEAIEQFTIEGDKIRKISGS